MIIIYLLKCKQIVFTLREDRKQLMLGHHNSLMHRSIYVWHSPYKDPCGTSTLGKGRTINDLGGPSGREFALSVFFFFRVVELSFFFPGRVAVEFFFLPLLPEPPPKSLMVLP